MQKPPLLVRVLENEESVGKAAAEFVADQVRRKPDSVLLLPTGRTPLIMYRYLVEMVRAGQLDLSRVHTFNLDEFFGLPVDHPGSYCTYMQQVLFDLVPIPVHQIHFPDSTAADPSIEAVRYEEEIRSVGGIDLAVLGIGVNGHIGFNEPGSDFDSRTRLMPITEETRAANAFLFNDRVEDVPSKALTTGIATITESRRILLLATGASKVDAIQAMLHGPVTPELPASILQQHPDVLVLVDREAAPQA